jgi:hypothetical protein
MKVLMKLALFSAAFLLLDGIESLAQPPSWQWVRSVNDSSTISAAAVAVDHFGNAFVTGAFQGNSPFFGNSIIRSNSLNTLYVIKYDSSGNLLWAVGGGYATGQAIAADAVGNVYVTGYYSDTLTLGNFTVNGGQTNGGTSFFLAKFNSNGEVVWLKSNSPTESGFGQGMVIDAGGNIYVSGYFLANTFILGNDTTILNNDSTFFNAFIAKYDSAGNVIWVKNVHGNGNIFAPSIAINSNYNLYITGWSACDTVTFGGLTLTDTGNAHYIYVARYDSSGNALWVQRTLSYNESASNGVAVDGAGNAYITGGFTADTIIFDTVVLINAGNTDLFIAKYDSSGNFQWAKRAGGTNTDNGFGITVDIDGYIYLTGEFEQDSIQFGNILLRDSLGSGNMFITKFDALGNVIWAAQSYCTGTMLGQAVVATNPDELFVTGFYYGSATFDTSTISDYTYEEGIFLAKMQNNVSTGIEEIHVSNDAIIYPNPTYGQFNLVCNSNIDEVLVTDLLGQRVSETKPETNSVNLAINAAGIYFVRIFLNNQEITKKLVVK